MKRQLTGQETELVLTFVRECIPFAEEMIGPVYGPYMGGDPRNFEPDPEASTEEQSERHRQACAVWERSERRFAIGFGYGGIRDKANDESWKRLKRLLVEF